MLSGFVSGHDFTDCEKIRRWVGPGFNPDINPGKHFGLQALRYGKTR
jgi:hypothetical protein